MPRKARAPRVCPNHPKRKLDPRNRSGVCFECANEASRHTRRVVRPCAKCRKPLYRGAKGDICAECLGIARTPEAKRAAIEDRLLAEVQEYIKKHPRKEVLRPVIKKAAKATDHEMILMLSDTHYPEVVDPAAALGIEYSPDICVRRIEYTRDTVIRYKDLRASSYHVRKLTVACIGDMLSGEIHDELTITNAFPMSEALVRLAHILVETGRGLAQEFPEVEFVFMPGNHPRKTKKPAAKNKWDNWDYVLGHFVAALAGDAFSVQVPKSLIYRQRVFDKVVGMMHGDGAKGNSFAGIPWYGLKRRQDAIQSLLRYLGAENLHYLLMGHFHRFTMMQGTDCDLIINGSVKGGDEFSIAEMHSANDPVQGLLTFHPKHGLTDASRINLRNV